MAPLQLSTVELLGLLAAIGFAGWSLWRRRWPRVESLVLLASGVIFFALMSLSGKKLGARYVLPVWPLLALFIAHSSVLVLWPRLAPVWKRCRYGVRATIASGALALYLGGATASLLPWGPDLLAYANPMLGGLRTLNAVSLVNGVAEKRVAAHLETLPADRRVLVAGHAASVQWHTRRLVESHACAMPPPRSRTRASPDFLVVSSYEAQRCPKGLTNEDGLLGTELKSFIWDGVALARLYQLPEPIDP